MNILDACAEEIHVTKGRAYSGERRAMGESPFHGMRHRRLAWGLSFKHDFLGTWPLIRTAGDMHVSSKDTTNSKPCEISGEIFLVACEHGDEHPGQM